MSSGQSHVYEARGQGEASRSPEVALPVSAGTTTSRTTVTLPSKPLQLAPVGKSNSAQ